MSRPVAAQGDPRAPWGRLPPEVVEPLRPHFDAAAEEMIEWIHHRVPDYARPVDSDYGRKMWRAVRRAVADFVEVSAEPDVSWGPLREIYAEIGAYEASRGRSLAGLQTAMMVCGQVASRRFSKDAARLGWSPELLGRLTEALFAFLDVISEAAAEGYAQVVDGSGTRRDYLRGRLHTLLTGPGPAEAEAVGQLARAAGWPLPARIAVAVLPGPAPLRPPVLPPAVLACWHGSTPSLILPDPDGPGQDRLLSALGGTLAVLGPPVDLGRGEVSLRWALQGLALAVEGRLPGKGLVRCADHLPLLLAAAGLEMVEAALPRRFGPLFELTPGQRARLVPTLAAYLDTGRNAVATAQRLGIHQQTVRYRLAMVEELVSGDLADPDLALELHLLLHAWQRLVGV